jgi:hypothetical protein
MGWFIIDTNEDFVGDLASGLGLELLRCAEIASLNKFLDEGIADGDLVDEIVRDIDKENDETLQYIADMLRDAKAPVVLTDGVV